MHVTLRVANKNENVSRADRRKAPPLLDAVCALAEICTRLRAAANGTG